MGLSWSGIKESASSIANKASVAREKIASSKAAGYASDTVAAGYGVGIHTLGGAAMGGTINAAAYADDGHAFTSAESLGSAFVSGAGYGGAAGLGLGLVHARKYAAMNAAKRTGSKKKVGTMTKATNELEQQKMADSVADMNAREMRAEQAQRSWADSQANARMQAAQRRNNGIKPPHQPNPDPLPGVRYEAPNVNEGNLQLLENENLQMPAVDFNTRKGFNHNDTIMSPNFGLQSKTPYSGPLLQDSPHNVRRPKMRPK